MGIIDLLKEVPLSAVLSENIIALETENKSLNDENAVLKIKLEESEQQRRTLEKQIEQKLIESHEDSLTEKYEKVLLAVAIKSGSETSVIEKYLGMSETETSEKLSYLASLKFVNKDLPLKPVVDPITNKEFLKPFDSWTVIENGINYMRSHDLLSKIV